ncbi:hypothetical protein VCSRO184_0242 [Vibrio cholerae]|nr:hypothetical protein VCSRO184_0242 [Vibrio cholerae]
MRTELSDQLNLHHLAKGRNAPSYKSNATKRVMVLRERAEQAALVEWADVTTVHGILIGEFLTHVPNEGKRGPQARNDFIELGGSAGYPDLILDIPTKRYAGLRIEMKAPEPFDAKVTSSQMAWHEKLRKMGYRVEVCRGLEEAKRIIIDYLSEL